MKRSVLLVTLLIVATGCGKERIKGETANPTTAETDEFILTIEVTAPESPAVFRLVLEARKQATLRFHDSQRYDFEVRDDRGEMVWKWSGDRVFLQVLGEVTLAAGERLSFEEVWEPEGPGTYVVTGKITADNAGLEVSAEFEAGP